MDAAKQDIGSLIFAYGDAAFEANHLENGLSLVLNLMREYDKKRFSRRAVESLSTTDAPKTLGRLFEAVNGKERFSREQKKLISRAIRERNFLIHDYWKARIRMTLSKEGRAWVIKDLARIRDLLCEANKIIDALAARYLREFHINFDDLDFMVEGLWESEAEPPKRLLH